jgi:hypothetical protein
MGLAKIESVNGYAALHQRPGEPQARRRLHRHRLDARYVREGLIDWRVFWWTALVGLPFVVLGTRFAASVPGEVMEPLVGGVIIAMVAVTLARRAAPTLFDPANLSPRLLLIGSALLIPAAFYSGWISAGSGVFTTFCTCGCCATTSSTRRP